MMLSIAHSMQILGAEGATKSFFVRAAMFEHHELHLSYVAAGLLILKTECIQGCGGVLSSTLQSCTV